MSLKTSERFLEPLLSTEPISDLPRDSNFGSLDESSEDGQQFGLTKDGDLQSPITPPVTSLKTGTVILLAGTVGTQKSKWISETPIEWLSDSLTLSPSEKRVSNDTPIELVIEHPEINIRSNTPNPSNIFDQFPPTEHER